MVPKHSDQGQHGRFDGNHFDDMGVTEVLEHRDLALRSLTGSRIGGPNRTCLIATSRPTCVSYACVTSLTHVAGEMFKMMADVELFHVPYRGAQVFPALIAGDGQVYFGPLLSSIEYVRAGKLRALAVTTVTRSPILPDVPALSETLPGYEASASFGVGAPKNTPSQIIDKLNEAINAGLVDPKFKARLADLGGTVLAGSPADFGKLIAEETEKWGKVVKFSGAKPE
jgi:tripartite-type tricarboxylate transporter receptor subunit TctC